MTLIVVSIAGSGVRFLTVTTDYRAFFKEDNPHLKAFEDLASSYTFTDDLLIVLAPQDGRVFSRATLAVIKEVTKSAWLTPHSIRADSLSNYLHTHAEGDNLISEFLVREPQDLSESDLADAKSLVLSEPSNAHRLVSPSGHTTAVHVTLFLQDKSEAQLKEVSSFAQDLANRVHTKHPDINVYLGGSVMLSSAFVESALGDLHRVIPGASIVVALVLFVVLRSGSAVLTVLLLIGFSELTAVGLAGWLKIPVSAVSINAPTIILTVGVAASIHILLTFFYYMRLGESNEQAIGKSLKVNLQPVLITNIATIISCLCLNLNNSPLYQDLGNVAALGVTASLIYTIFFLPALISLLPIRRQAVIDSGHGFANWMGNLVVKRHNFFFWGMLLLMLILIAPLPRLEMNEKITDFFHKRLAFHKDMNFIAKNFTGINTIEYSFDSGEKRGILSPDYLSSLDNFSSWLIDQPGVVYVNSVSDIVKRIHRTMHGDDDSFYRIPEDRNLTAPYMLLYEMSLPEGFDLDSFIRPDESASRFTAVMDNVSPQELLDAEQQAQNWLKNNDGLSAVGTGPFVMFAHITKENIINMLTGSLTAITLMSILLIILFGNLKIGLISLIPNMAPAAMALGLWGYIDGKVGLAVSVVVIMSLGIVVDDTIYFLVNYIRFRKKQGLSPEIAVLNTFQTVGSALWITTLVLTAGFSTLLLSGFTVNATMGFLTAITILFALAFDCLFLPALLLKLEKK